MVDLPFRSLPGKDFKGSALNSTIRIMKETGAHSIKLEGGEEVLESVKEVLFYLAVPVMGHLGFNTPVNLLNLARIPFAQRKRQKRQN